jgi:hypothetical protein
VEIYFAGAAVHHMSFCCKLPGGIGINHFSLISAVYTMSLIFAFKCLFWIWYMSCTCPKALATVISICSLYVILLLKMTPRYFLLFTNGLFCPFSLSLSSWILHLLEKLIAWDSPSLIFTFQRSHHNLTAVTPHCNLLWVFIELALFYVG